MCNLKIYTSECEIETCGLRAGDPSVRLSNKSTPGPAGSTSSAWAGFACSAIVILTIFFYRRRATRRAAARPDRAAGQPQWGQRVNQLVGPGLGTVPGSKEWFVRLGLDQSRAANNGHELSGSGGRSRIFPSEWASAAADSNSWCGGVTPGLGCSGSTFYA